MWRCTDREMRKETYRRMRRDTTRVPPSRQLIRRELQRRHLFPESTWQAQGSVQPGSERRPANCELLGPDPGNVMTSAYEKNTGVGATETLRKLNARDRDSEICCRRLMWWKLGMHGQFSSLGQRPRRQFPVQRDLFLEGCLVAEILWMPDCCT